MMKNVLIIAGLVFLFYACTLTYAQPQPPTPTSSAGYSLEERAGCYERINVAARDDWPIMSKVERLSVAMRAISVCEGSTP